MTEEEQTAADKARKDAEGGENMGNIDKVLQHLTGLTEKMDAMGKRMDAMEMRKPEERKDNTALTHQQIAEENRKEESARADAQCRADSAYQAWGMQAAPPMQSEKPLAYRKRLARGLQRHSSIFKEADLDVLSADPKLFDRAEQMIYADAVVASKNPSNEGRQIERVVVDPDTGHRIRTFHGGDTIFKLLAVPSKRVQKIFDTRSVAAR